MNTPAAKGSWKRISKRPLEERLFKEEEEGRPGNGAAFCFADAQHHKHWLAGFAAAR
ncbi:hypothetical protein [Neorhizobium sp. LjRoot104]|uniref:hypothetical protein n=1 Tax=Neorhizobium sp. LjRoot104 TaxID=3342254 RepID=UPI003ECFD8C7